MSFYNEVVQDDPSAYWRMNDSPETKITYLYNRCPRPSLESANLGTWGVNGNIYGTSRLSGDRFADTASQEGGYVYRMTATATSDYLCWVLADEGIASPETGYSVSAYVRSSKTTEVRMDIDFLRDDGSLTSISEGVWTDVPAGAWVRVWNVGSAPSDAATIRGVPVLPQMVSGDTLDVDAVLYDESTGELRSYFDGDYVNAEWLGTFDESSSRLTLTDEIRNLVDQIAGHDGTYTASGVTFGVAALLGDGDPAVTFAAGSATVTANSGAWELGTMAEDVWSVEFLAQFSVATPVLSTDLWSIESRDGSSLSYGPPGGAAIGPTTGAVSTPSSWHHYMLTFDGASLTWYVDGASAGSNIPAALDAAGAGALVFGDGDLSLDEVVVYPIALASTQANEHYLSVDDPAEASVRSMELSPASVQLLLVAGDPDPTQQFAAIITYSDGTSEDISSTVSWSSSNPAVVSIDTNGVATGLDVGTAGITATDPATGAAGLASVSVAEPQPIPPTGPAIYGGDPQLPIYDDVGNLIGTTGEYWEVDFGRQVDGEWIYDRPVPLATYAWNITTLSGRDGIPVSDGENIRINTRAGRRWVPKTPDERVLSLAMWVQGTERDGKLPAAVALRTKFQENYTQLKQLFSAWDHQLLLRRRVATRFGITIQETFAEPSSGMDISPTGPMRGAFTIDLTLADPFWYGMENYTNPVPVETTKGVRRYPRSYPLAYGVYTNQTGVFEIENIGTHSAKMFAEFRGPFRNPALLNTQTGEKFRLVHDVSIDDGDVVDVDFYDKRIVLRGTGSRYWWFDRNSTWLKFRPGTSRFQLTHDGPETTGYLVLKWRPSYV